MSDEIVCVYCGDKNISSVIEQKLQLCIPCIEKRTQEYNTLKDEMSKLQNDAASLFSQLEFQKKQNSMFEQLMAAERNGVTAAERGLPEDQNPHVVDSNEHVMWLAGWTAIDTRRRGLQAHAVMVWSGGVLESIIELAKGYDQTEIAVKLEVVTSKFKNFVDPG